MGVKRLDRIQFGKEATAGTAVAADTMWLGNGVVVDDAPIEFYDADVGTLVQDGTSYRPHSSAALAMEETPASFELLPVILSAGIEDVTTGVADGGGSGYIYQYDVSTSSVQTPKSYTIEGGDDQESDEMEYCEVSHFTLSGASREAVMVSADWFGRQLTDCAFTAALSPLAVDTMQFAKCKFFLDDTTVGTTSVSGTLVGFNLDVDTGRRPLYAADGTSYFGQSKGVGCTITGELTLEHNATGEAERGKAQSESVRYIRIRCEGDTLTTAGTTYTYKTFISDMAIKYTEVPSIEDQDGNNVVTLPFRAVNNLDPQFIVVNERADV